MPARERQVVLAVVPQRFAAHIKAAKASWIN